MQGILSSYNLPHWDTIKVTLNNAYKMLLHSCGSVHTWYEDLEYKVHYFYLGFVSNPYNYNEGKSCKIPFCSGFL